MTRHRSVLLTALAVGIFFACANPGAAADDAAHALAEKFAVGAESDDGAAQQQAGAKRTDRKSVV